MDTLGDYDSALANVEDHETLRPLLAELPERERTVVLLRFFGNLTQTQIAEQTRHIPDARLPSAVAHARAVAREDGVATAT